MLLGLTGPAGVGKDTVAMLLRDYGFSSYAIASPLKKMLAAAGLREPKTREEKEANLPGRQFSFRKAAQTLGTGWARSLEENFWLILAEQTLFNPAEQELLKHDRLVITDVRFENEAAWLRQRGGKLIHISGRATTVDGEAAKHASEAGIKPIPGDLYLVNDATLAELNGKTCRLLSSIYREMR